MLAPPATPDWTFVVDTPEKDGTTCVTWNGAPFREPSQGQELGEEVDVTPGHQVSELVDVTGQGFTAFPV